MLRGSEITVLQNLTEEQSIGELAEKLQLSRSYVSELVSQLEEKELVFSRRDGREKLVRPARYSAVERLQDMGQRSSHIAFSDLLSGMAIPVLYYLDRPRTVAELAELTDNYRNTIHRVLKRLLDHGIVGKTDAQYQLNDEFQELNRFATEYIHHLHSVKVPASSFTILWEDFDEFLIQTEQQINIDRFLETGPNRFQDFGIPLVTTSNRYYLYSEHLDRLTVPHLVANTLLIDSGSRYQTYCLLLIQKHSSCREELRGVAERYSVEDKVEPLLNYLETAGEEKQLPDLPSWDEFESVAAQYGVET